MEHIRVIARIRPELTSACQSCVTMIENCVDSIELREPEGGARPYPHSRRTRPTKTFTLDRVFGPNAVQEDVYEHVKPRRTALIQGPLCSAASPTG